MERLHDRLDYFKYALLKMVHMICVDHCVEILTSESMKPLKFNFVC